MARMRLLDLARPFLAVMPEVPRPYQKIDDYEKLIYVVGAAIIFNILSELPLYGARDTLLRADPIWWLRDVLASASGTPVELGVFPIVLSGLTLQLLAGAKKLNVSLDLKADRTLFQSAQKLLALSIVVLFSALLVVSGSYGSVSQLGVQSSFFIFVQLVAGNGFLVIIDELLQKGYGLGSGILVFTTLKVAQRFTWAMASMQAVNTIKGPEFLGAIPNFVSKITNRSIGFALVDSTFRVGLPNLLNIVIAIGIFMAMVALSSIRYDIPVRSTKARATNSTFPIRLMYSGALPVLFWASLMAAIHLPLAAVYSLWPSSQFVQLTGRWDFRDNVRVASSGLAYYLSPPLTVADALWDPIRTVLYVAATLSVIVWFSRAWVESSGFAAADIAKQFKEGGIVIVGRRDLSVQKELKRLLPQAATVGGLLLGAAVVSADIFGATGWGAIMSVGVLQTLAVFEELSQENIGPQTLANMKI